MGRSHSALRVALAAIFLGVTTIADLSQAERAPVPKGRAVAKKTNRHIITVVPAETSSSSEVTPLRARTSNSQLLSAQNRSRAVINGLLTSVAPLDASGSKIGFPLGTSASDPNTVIASNLSQQQVEFLRRAKLIKEISPVYAFPVESKQESYKSLAIESSSPTPLYHPTQWGLDNLGDLEATERLDDGSSKSYSAKEDVDIDAPKAWQQTIGEGGAIVAIIDTGVHRLHPNLKDNLFYRTGEIGGDKIDNDKNGYVDDVYGANIALRSGDITDSDYHGTHVSGIIAASPRTDDATKPGDLNPTMTGVAPGIKFLMVKATRDCEYGSCFNSDDLLEAYRYVLATKRAGYNIVAVNLSLGGYCDLMSAAEKSAIQDLVKEGITVVAAAGNSGEDNDQKPVCPASLGTPGILSVGSVSLDGVVPSYSNFGAKSVHFAAPGSFIYSTIPETKLPDGKTVLYHYLSGTSMAAPMVSGIVALMKAVNPLLTPATIQEVLLSTTKPIQGFPSRSRGMVNANNAVKRALESVVSGKVQFNNKPLEGVEVALIANNQRITTSTNKRGEYFFPRPPIGTPYTIMLSKPLFQFSAIESKNDSLTTIQKLTTTASRETRTVRGVISISGKPLEGVTVSAFASFPDNEQFTSSTRSDAKGEYTLPVPYQKEFFLSPKKAGFAFPNSSKGLFASGDMSVNFEATASSISIQGAVVVESEAGSKLASPFSGTVTLYRVNGTQRELITSARAQGARFSFFDNRIVAGGTYELHLTHSYPSYKPAQPVQITPASFASVEPGSYLSVSFSLQKDPNFKPQSGIVPKIKK